MQKNILVLSLKRAQIWFTAKRNILVTLYALMFVDVRVLLCDFHREQSWERWVNRKENGASNPDVVLASLRLLAKSYNEENFNINLNALKQFGKRKIADVEKMWLPLKEVNSSIMYTDIRRWIIIN